MKHETFFLREDRRDVTLTSYVLDYSHKMPGSSLRPAVIICPGGAYLYCSDREGEPIAMAFANMGYHAFVLRYGIYYEGQTDIFAPIPEEQLLLKEHCIHPNPIRDIARAMDLIREHAEEWRVDTGSIAVCGFSAGAHNAAMYATHWHRPVITDWFGKPAEEFRPAACILAYTLSDYIFMKDAPDAMTDPVAADMFTSSDMALLGTLHASDEQRRAVSPALQVTAHTPPTFLWATAEDTLVPVQHTLRMARALADQNIPFEMHVFESGPHGMATATHSTAAGVDTVSPHVARWLPMCDSWLRKIFKLPF